MDRDEAIEALRQVFTRLQRYSFLKDAQGSVRRVPDSCGNWVDWQQVHELFDPVMVDAAVAAMQSREVDDADPA